MYKKRFTKYNDQSHTTSSFRRRPYGGRSSRESFDQSKSRYGTDGCCSHEPTLFAELLCHAPTVLIALSISFIIGSIFHEGFFRGGGEEVLHCYRNIFHLCHYTHILCAGACTAIVLFRGIVQSPIVASIVSLVSALVFCTLSDIVFPSIGAMCLGVTLPIHLCFCSWQEGINLIIFVTMGIFLGACVAYNQRKNYENSFLKNLHLFHIVLGCLAAYSYILAHTFFDCVSSAGMLVFMLFIAVVIPCVIADRIVPYVAEKLMRRRNNIYDYTEV